MKFHLINLYTMGLDTVLGLYFVENGELKSVCIN